TGHTLLAQMTRFGPVVQIGTKEEVGEEGKPRFANLKPGQSIETIEFDEAMELFKLPITLGDYDGLEVIVNAGRFGPYVKHNEKFISLGRSADPMTVTMEQAIELIEAKKKEDAPIGTYKGHEITKGKGRFGPFLKWNELFINIPKRIDPETIKMEEAFELIEAKIEKEANRYIQQWTDEKIALENGRWGPFIRFKKKSFKLPKKDDGEKWTSEELKETPLEQVKKWLKDQGAKGIKK
ncbi:MAG: DNA topoisomerase I, partial [Saprospiraceae bacterium]|nr:DNA topoisomerase I [Saprospiraceae bacterium]